jgi:uncharacterized protein (TIGR04222 family)
MSEPVFLTLYGLALVLAVLLGLRLKRVAGSAPPEPLSFEEIGFLGGGPVRAAEVAVTALVSENRVRNSDGVLFAIGSPNPTTAGSPLQAIVLARLAAGPRRLDDVLLASTGSAAVRQLGHRLLGNGLLVAPATRARRAVVSVLPVFALAAVAVARLVVEGSTGLLVTALVVTGGSAVLLLLGPPPLLTRAGSRAYEQATAGLAPVDPAELTARFGLQRSVTREAVPETYREDVRRTAAPAVFDGEQREPIAVVESSDEPLPRRRQRVVIVEPQRWQRRNGWLVAGGWLAGGWLASSWLGEGGDDGDFGDFDFGDFGS